MIKKVALTLLFLAIAITASFFIWRFISYKTDKDPNKTFLLPHLELSDLEITTLDTEKMEMTVKMLIKNQLPISFTADSLQYRLFINDTEVMKDHYKKAITLKGSDSSLISLPVTVFTRDLFSILKANEKANNDSANYRLQLSFYTHIIFKKQFTLTIKKRLPLITIPRAKAEHIVIDSLNFKRAVLRLTVSIDNKNGFATKAKDIAYRLSIENNQLVSGIIPGLTDIRANGITDITIPVTLSLKDVGKTLFDLLKKGTNVSYKLRLAFNIESGSNMIMNSKVTLESEGSVKSLIKVAKKAQ